MPLRFYFSTLKISCFETLQSCYDWSKGAEHHNPVTAKTYIFLHLPRVNLLILILMHRVFFFLMLNVLVLDAGEWPQSQAKTSYGGRKGNNLLRNAVRASVTHLSRNFAFLILIWCNAITIFVEFRDEFLATQETLVQELELLLIFFQYPHLIYDQILDDLVECDFVFSI